MPDQITIAAANAAKPGSESSEFDLAKKISQIASIVTLLGAIAAVLPESVSSGNKYVALAIAAIGAITKVLMALGYIKGRTDLKTAAINAAVEILPAAAPAVREVAAAIPDSVIPQPPPPA